MSDLTLTPAVAAALQRWHGMVERRDFSELPSMLDEQVVFRSPMAHTPYPGVQVVSTILSTVIQVFEGFTSHRQMADDDGLNVMLEFSAELGGRKLKGNDLNRFNDQGRIVDFEVMVRPMSGLQALGEEMGRRLAPYLSALKGQAATE